MRQIKVLFSEVCQHLHDYMLKHLGHIMESCWVRARILGTREPSNSQHEEKKDQKIAVFKTVSVA